MARELSILHPAGRMAVGANPFGKDVANIGLFRALIRHGGFDRVHVATHLPVPASQIAADVSPPGAPPVAALLTAGATVDAGPFRETGMLLRGQPDLAELAWLRRRTGGDGGFSLAGLVHSIAAPAMRALIAESVTAPLHPWDAVICTSPSVVNAIETMLDGWTDHLNRRFGGSLRPRPALPVIPLGVDAPALAAAADRPQVRARRRAALGVAPDEVLVLWVGRLSFFEKAFPQPMFRAVQEASAASGVRARFAMAGWFPDAAADRPRFETAARAYAPDVPVLFLDGDDPALVAELWAAADIFLSLVDNVQETFGITPVEAMAAGLPVVVSDWDGYRSTVRDGVEGFLAPTLGGAPGALGELTAARHNLGVFGYHTYVGALAQHTAVSVGGAARALGALMADPALRRRMGEAGRARVRQGFDWPVVARRYAALFDALAEVRAAAPPVTPLPRLNPVRGDPFADFAGFPTTVLTDDTRLVLRSAEPQADLRRAAAVELDGAFPGWRADAAETQALAAALTEGAPVSLAALLARFPHDRRPRLEATVVWLVKLGLLDLAPFAVPQDSGPAEPPA